MDDGMKCFAVATFFIALTFCFCVHRVCVMWERTTWKEVEAVAAKNTRGHDGWYWKGKYEGITEAESE